MPGRRLVPLILALLACSPSSAEPPPRTGSAPKPVASGTAPTAGAVAESAAADPREPLLASTVGALLEREHLRGSKLDDAMSRIAYKTYIKRLDPSKMFLLAKDAASLDKYADKIDDEMHSGALELAHAGATIFSARVTVVEKLVAEILAAPMNFSDDEWVELDPDKLQLCATEAELRDRWRRRLELEVLERVEGMEARLASKSAPPKKKPSVNGPTGPAGIEAPVDDDESGTSSLPITDIPTTAEGREAKARRDIALSYAGRFTRLRVPASLGPATALINAVTAAYDPHTDYLPPAEKANFDIQMSGSLQGIGAVLREKDHYVEVAEIVPGGASFREGHLAQGDLILTVTNTGKDPVDIADMRIDEVVAMIRGPKGTVVKLRVRKTTGEEVNIAITRDVVVIEDAYARGAILEHGKDKRAWGYILLPSFYGGQGSGQRTAAADMRRLLEQMKALKVAGVILDLRTNGGGFLGAAVEITGELVDRGPVVEVQDSAGRKEVLADTDRGTSYDGPVVVMVDRFSASASEIVAAALQDYHRAVIVGTTTHGKGTVQSLAPLDRLAGGNVDLGVLKITIQQFFRVNGASTQLKGVTPDVVLPDPAGHIDSGERELENAMPFVQIDPAPHDNWPMTWKTEKLVGDSAARVAADPVLSKIVSRSKLLRTWRDDTRMPLTKAAWEARRNERKTALEAISPDLSKIAPRMTVKPLEDDQPKALTPAPGGKTDDRLTRWRESLARDPWVDESLSVLGQMTPAAP